MTAKDATQSLLEKQLNDAMKMRHITAADAASIWGQASQTATTATINPNILLGPQVYRAQYEFETTGWTMLYHMSVEKAENGYILKVTHKQGDTAKLYVAADTEELQRVFIAALVAERVTK